MPRHVPWRLWQWAADRLASDWYDIWALTLEAQAARELIARRGTVHILNGEDTYRLLGFVPRASRGRLVCTYHLTPRGLRELLPSARRLRRLDAGIALTRQQGAFLAERVGEDRTFVIPHGVDTGHFAPGGEAPQSGSPTCLFVGSWLRDFDVLSAVIRAVGEREPDVRFRVLSGDERIAPLAALPTVVASGRVEDDELLEAYRSADLFLMPL